MSPGRVGTHPALSCSNRTPAVTKKTAQKTPTFLLMKTPEEKSRAELRNEDPLSGAPGAHPVGTGVGAASGGMAGAAVGIPAGPVGMAIGGAIGAVVGGLVGKGVAEAVDPTLEDAYWRENYRNENYVEPDMTYDDYGPAYRAGYETYSSGKYKDYGSAESDIAGMWDARKDKSRLSWEKAKHASRAAWDRVERAMPGDADRDGK